MIGEGSDKEKPRLGEKGERRASQRHRRLARALRENLSRRKRQARARAADDGENPGKANGDDEEP